MVARRRLASGRAGARLWLALAVLAALPSTGWAQTSRLVRIEDADIVVLVEQLQAAGFDVVEGSVRAGSAELVVSAAELDELGALGYTPEILAEGRPLGRAPGSIQTRSLLPETLTSSNLAVPLLRERLSETAIASASAGATAVTVSFCQSPLPEARSVGSSLSHFEPRCQAR